MDISVTYIVEQFYLVRKNQEYILTRRIDICGNHRT